MDGLLKTTVCNLHLLITEALFDQGVSPATANPQARLIDLDLEVIRANTSEIHFYYPALIAAIDVGRWIPQSTRWSDTTGDS